MKRGQVDLSFSMIFSITLIIVFIGFAGYAIMKFIDLQEYTDSAGFYENLQANIDDVWKSPESSTEVSFSLSKKITQVCITNFLFEPNNMEETYDEFELISQGEKNLFFYPIGASKGFDAGILKHLNIEKITKIKNPYCFENINGKIKITFEKRYNETMVTLK